jgi:Transposase DDE domain
MACVHDAVILGLSTPESRAMHASTILRRSLDSVLAPMPALRRRVLLQATEALIEGRRLTMTDLSRSWPGATYSHAPLKAVDRLLRNGHVQQSIQPLSRAMAIWLLSCERPVLIVDWVDLQRDGRWCMLRAGLPTHGRTVTVYERIYPIDQINGPQAQRSFLVDLAQIVPTGVRPIVVTDAGFRSDWFRAVAAQGWDYVGRVRNNVKACKGSESKWFSCSDLYVGASRRAEELGTHQIVQGQPWGCRLLRVRREHKGRHQLTRAGTPNRGTDARRHRKSAREPWLLATSLSRAQYTPAQVVVMYGKRMQIEESFRDLKSHRYGMGFEDSQTRDSKRLSVLMLLNLLAGFATWLLSLAVARTVIEPDPLAARPSMRARYSNFRRAIEWLRMPAWPPPLAEAVRAITHARPNIAGKLP